ncbi:MAG: D-tyrosyl-tRNA(Tyr) deacylase [Bacteroidetes bacterium]|nr:D-tyrosyl-tRNA(Tyr) deacylase [Bacteroidota bacterium]
MRVVIQRVLEAAVRVDNQVSGKIGKGLLILAGFEDADTTKDLEWMASKISKMRLFPDEAGVMNKSVLEAGGELLVVSQFTLHADARKGNRPSYIKAARPEKAIPLYEEFKQVLSREQGKPVACGIFGADMKVSLINDGPVTILLDSQKDLNA